MYNFIVNLFMEVWATPSPTCNVFASALTAKNKTYISWRQDSGARARDAFLTEDWTGFPYLFPPTPLMPRVLGEIRRRKLSCILVAPLWQMKSWFPILRSMERARVPLPLARLCLTHKVYDKVDASMDPLHVFLRVGSQ